MCLSRILFCHAGRVRREVDCNKCNFPRANCNFALGRNSRNGARLRNQNTNYSIFLQYSKIEFRDNSATLYVKMNVRVHEINYNISHIINCSLFPIVYVAPHANTYFITLFWHLRLYISLGFSLRGIIVTHKKKHGNISRNLSALGRQNTRRSRVFLCGMRDAYTNERIARTERRNAEIEGVRCIRAEGDLRISWQRKTTLCARPMGWRYIATRGGRGPLFYFQFRWSSYYKSRGVLTSKKEEDVR